MAVFRYSLSAFYSLGNNIYLSLFHTILARLLRLTMFRKAIPLRFILVSTFVFQTAAAVSLTMWLAWNTEQRSIEERNQDEQTETLNRISDKLNEYLEFSAVINRLNRADLANQGLNLDNPNQLTQQFWKQRSLLTTVPVTAIYFGDVQGRFIGLRFQGDRTWQISQVNKQTDGHYYSYAVNNEGQISRLLSKGELYNLKQRPWYTNALQSERPCWNAVYQDSQKSRPQFTISERIYNKNQALLGVVGVDFSVEQISIFLRSLITQELPSLMILDRRGKIVGTSTQQNPFKVRPDRTEWIDVADLEDSLLSQTAPHVSKLLEQWQTRKLSQQISFEYQQNSYSLRASPLQNSHGLELLVVSVVPQSTFWNRVPEQHRASLLLGIVVLMTAILFGLVTARRLSQGLRELIRSGEKLAQEGPQGFTNDSIYSSFENSRIEELSNLAKAFNRMATHLQGSFDKLEARVQERTQALRQSEEKFAKIFYTHPNPIAISRVRDGCFVDINDSALELFSIERETVLGKSFFDLDLGVNPEQRQQIIQSIQTHGPIRSLETYPKTKGRETCIVLYSADLIEVNEELYLISILDDITDRKLAEEALRRSEEKFAKIFHSNPNPMTISRVSDGYILDFNASALKFFGAQKEDVIGKTSFELNFWLDYAHREEILQALRQQQIVRGLEYNVRTHNGKTRTVLFSAEMIEVDGQFCLVSTMNDISDRRESEVALQQAKLEAEAANRAKSRFLSNMSHELRTPLNAILGFTQVMNRDTSLSPNQRDRVDIISRSSEHLLEMINDVLDMAKIESGRVDIYSNSFDLYRLLETLDNMFSMRLLTKGIALVIEQIYNVPQFIKTDEGKLRQILINLIGNAIKFTDEGQIRVKVRLIEDRQSQEKSNTLLFFDIEDTGVGIANSELDSIFEAFFQGKQGSSSGRVGTGLGLPICREFVQLLNGNIGVSSKLGGGSLFQFYIPVETVSEINQLSSPRSTELSPKLLQHRILVVDDRWECRQLVAQVLEPLGLDLRDAKNGQEAITVWQAWNPHLILMDMVMPVMSGHTASQYIKTHLQGRDTVIIALTTSTLEADTDTILDTGCDAVIRKPFREAEILQILEQYLGIQCTVQGNKLSNNSSRVGVIKQPTDNLRRALLESMSKEWIIQVHEAAQKVDNAVLLLLIAQISDSSHLLRDTLINLVKNFRCDVIFELTEPQL
jgi:PAS domain S-box-containing protein